MLQPKPKASVRDKVAAQLQEMAYMSGKFRHNVDVLLQESSKRDTDILEELGTKMIEVEILIARFIA